MGECSRKKGFVIPTKSFVTIGITKIFCYNNKLSILVLSTKRLVAAAKCLVEATKNSFVVPNFVAVTKTFFSVICKYPDLSFFSGALKEVVFKPELVKNMLFEK